LVESVLALSRQGVVDRGTALEEPIMASSAFLLAPINDHIPVEPNAEWVEEYEEWCCDQLDAENDNDSLADFFEATGTASKISISDMTYGSYKRTKPRCGGTQACLVNDDDGYTFELHWHGYQDIAALLEMARVYGGDYVAVRTYGQCMLMLLVRNPESGASPEHEQISLRLVRPAGIARPEAPWERLKAWFEASDSFGPDLGALRDQYEADQISVTTWFEALGIQGARDIGEPVLPDADETWEEFRTATEALMRGEEADPSIIKRLNKIFEGEARLSVKPKKGRGKSAQMIVESHQAMLGAAGEPKDPVLVARYRAGDMYDAITESPAGEMLTIGRGKRGLGESAALGRLLGHYPKELTRDGIAIAMMANDAEAWNGHCYVPSFQTLAEHATQAGFTLAVYPTTLRGQFHNTFGLIPSEGEPRECDGWAADAFIDLPGLLKADPIEALEDWFCKQEADGVIVRCEPDGRFALTYYQTDRKAKKAPESVPGSGNIDRKVLADAGKTLWPRGVFAALGMPDMLEPGEFCVDEQPVGGMSEEERVWRRRALELLKKLPKPRSVGSLDPLIQEFPRGIEYKNRDWDPEEIEVPIDERPLNVIRVTVPTDDARYLEAIAKDLQQDYRGPQYCWVSGRHIYGCSPAGSTIAPRTLISLLADLPRGSRLAARSRHPAAEAHAL